MIRLLNKQLRLFTVFAFFILVCSIPVYYYVIDTIWIEELDEHNEFVKDRIKAKFSENSFDQNKLVEVIEFWNMLEPGTSFVPIKESEVREDTIYEVTREDKYEEGDFDRYRVLSSDLKIQNQYYRLTVETNVEEAGETIAIIGLVTVAFFLLMLIGFIILNRRISAKVWRPFQATLHKLKGFRLSDEKTVTFDDTKILEFAELNKELEKLIANNLEVYQKQKRFVENASHELQTPLAVLKSKLDLLLQSEDLTEKQAKLVNSVSLPLSRMIRLNKNLLILAKIENQQFSEAKNLDVLEPLQENLQLLQDYYLSKNLNVVEDLHSGSMVNANPLLVETLLSNLLTNAIKFSKTGGTIEVYLKDRLLSISNAGEESLLTEGLFERFTNVSKESGSSGLGLAIIKEICESYGWKLNYRFENHRHLFSVEF